MSSLWVTFYASDDAMPQAIAEQVTSLFRKVYGVADPDEAFGLPRHRERERGRFVASRQGEVVGYLSVLQPRNDLAQRLKGLKSPRGNLVEVGGLMVAPDQRRQGVGAEMLLRAVDFARGLKMEPFGLVQAGNQVARRFFEGIQWVEWSDQESKGSIMVVYLGP